MIISILDLSFYLVLLDLLDVLTTKQSADKMNLFHALALLVATAMTSAAEVTGVGGNKQVRVSLRGQTKLPDSRKLANGGNGGGVGKGGGCKSKAERTILVSKL